MAHLGSETLIDLVEDTIDPSDRQRAAAHLASCVECRQQLEEARRLLAVAAEVEVPEPSPLFWDHLSSRVREAVAVEDVSPAPVSPASLFARLWAAPRMQVAGVLSACAVAVLAVVTILPDRAARPDGQSGVASAPAVVAEADAADAIATEASLDLLATLADGMSWDDASEAGLTAAPGAVDDAIMGLTAEERIELQRLLQEELARGGSGGPGALLGSGAVRVQG